MTTTPLAPFTAAMFQAFAGVESSNPLFAIATNSAGDEVTLVVDGTLVELYLVDAEFAETICRKEYPEGHATAVCVAESLLCHCEQSADLDALCTVLERFAFEIEATMPG